MQNETCSDVNTSIQWAKKIKSGTSSSSAFPAQLFRARIKILLFATYISMPGQPVCKHRELLNDTNWTSSNPQAADLCGGTRRRGVYWGGLCHPGNHIGAWRGRNCNAALCGVRNGICTQSNIDPPPPFLLSTESYRSSQFINNPAV